MPLRILLAEDNAINQKLVLRFLQRLGYEADVAENGLEALEALRKQPYDIILMDVEMPKMDGLETTRCIRREWPDKSSPRIIALTANTMEEDRIDCQKAGMDDYIEKPIRFEELNRVLDQYRPPEEMKSIEGLGQIGLEEVDKPLDTFEKPALQTSSVLDYDVFDKLIDMTGDTSFVLGLIDNFIASTPQMLVSMQQAFEKGNAADLRIVAHTLKSSSADFGAMCLSELFKDLEFKSKTGIPEDFASLIGQIKLEYEHVEEALKSIHIEKRYSGIEEDQINDYRGHILVVDDYPINRKRLSHLLKQQGHTVIVAENGREAIEIINNQSLDIMLLDIIMPEMDGYQVLKYLKHNNMLQGLPVIVISALDEMDSVIQCIAMGAEDYLPKLFDPVLLKARIGACLEKKRLHDLEIKHREELNKLNKELEVRNRFIRKTFGRYLSDDIVDTILESPEGLSLGGENRIVTIMMTDIRGFTAISEQLPPKGVVNMLNNYLDVMTDIIFKYKGTIDEIIGDAILAIFGAPIIYEDDAKRAVACALEMQLSMEKVNQKNRETGLPELAMGIGINTGEVVVGNIGSSKRVKYSVVGPNVNRTSRIESFTMGGQTLIAHETMKACNSILRIDSTMEVTPKGFKQPITIYEVGGIGGDFSIFLPERGTTELKRLQIPLNIEFTTFKEKQAVKKVYEGTIVKLAGNKAEIQAKEVFEQMTNLKISLFDNQQNQITDNIYAKIERILSSTPVLLRVHFSYVPPEANSFFKTIL
ncbi:MAG: response regulator [Thermodesulfobacteriota bacterium]|nr:response regulator [Thermodesulfobacteriota bacterium]